MQMHDFRFLRQMSRKMHDAFGKENKSLRVVAVIVTVLVVDSRAIEIFRLINEVNGQPRSSLQREQFCIYTLRAERKIELPIDALHSGKSFAHAAIQRCHH
jgi:hypothetical protein